MIKGQQLSPVIEYRPFRQKHDKLTMFTIVVRTAEEQASRSTLFAVGLKHLHATDLFRQLNKTSVLNLLQQKHWRKRRRNTTNTYPSWLTSCRTSSSSWLSSANQAQTVWSSSPRMHCRLETAAKNIRTRGKTKLTVSLGIWPKSTSSPGLFPFLREKPWGRGWA